MRIAQQSHYRSHHVMSAPRKERRAPAAATVRGPLSRLVGTSADFLAPTIHSKQGRTRLKGGPETAVEMRHAPPGARTGPSSYRWGGAHLNF